ncbi:MAG TPA: PRC-barrel domain-containing protein, partial [Anaerolineales bacterium]
MSATVNDKNNQRVGSVQDLILNLVTRHVDYLMVRTDSAAHPTSAPDLEVTPAPNYNVVSWQAVTGILGNAITLNVDAAAVSGAPVLETRAVPFLTPSDWKATFDSYWKKNLPASTNPATTTVTKPAAIPGGISGYLVASDILGQNLQTPNGQQIGAAKDLLVNVKTGDVAYLLVTSGPAVQAGQKLIPVPLQLLGHNLESGAFTLPIPSSVLNLAPSIDLNNLPASAADWMNT